jgi:redox-sensing transcriptional repressor
MSVDIPDVVVRRLPTYLRALRRLADNNVDFVSSYQLGERLHVTPAQIRKDLSYFGRFGKQGRGYNIQLLIADLDQILGLDHEWATILVGVGRLGRAIIGYPGFTPEGFNLVAAFDSDSSIVGQEISGILVRHTSDVEDFIKENRIHIAILAVPAEVAQIVADKLIENKIHSFVSYAPVPLEVPRGVYVRSLDPILAMEEMTFYLRDSERGRCR